MSPRNNHTNSISSTARIVLVSLAPISLLLTTLSTNRARGEEYIEGSVGASVSLDGVGGASCGTSFIKGASSGLDEFDHLYYEIPSPTDAYVKAVGSVDGNPAYIVSNPPLPKVVGSSGGAGFSCSFVVGEGKMVVLDNASYSFSASGSIDGCRVTVNGVDLSSGEEISGGTISGTFTEGEYSIGDIDISVEYIGTGGNGEEPNNPDPNTPDPNIPLDAGPHILRIDNVHEKLPTKTFKLVYKLGATEGIDSFDQEYTLFSGVPPPFIVSQVGDKYLTVDNRDTKSRSQVFFKQMAYSDYGFSRISGGDTNALVFSFPSDEGTNHKFGERILTFQEYAPDANAPDANEPNSPNASEPNISATSFPEPNGTYPVYLIRELIEDGNGLGVVALPNFERRIYNGTLHNFILRTDSSSRELAVGDFNKDGKVDANDCNALTSAMGHAGNSVYDIASADPNDPNVLYIGIRPDKKVDECDKKAIYQLMDADKKRREEADNTQAERFGVIPSASFLRDKLRTTGRKIASLCSQ
jgi:hypothetical protein